MFIYDILLIKNIIYYYYYSIFYDDIILLYGEGVKHIIQYLIPTIGK